MDIHIKRLEPGDEAVLERVAEDVFDEAIDSGRLSAYLAEPNHHLIVAIKAGEVVGQVAAVVHKHPDKPDELYIDEVGVTPALQRQGIATQILGAMLAFGKELGCEEAWLGTENTNRQAKEFYASFGAASAPIVMYTFKLGKGGV